MAANTKYKDSVFSFLFSDPDVLRELYGALKNIRLPPDVPVTINTLKNVLYMGRINDIRCQTLNVWHQREAGGTYRASKYH